MSRKHPGPFRAVHYGGDLYPLWKIVDQRTGAESKTIVSREAALASEEQLNKLFVEKFGAWTGRFIK